MDNKLSNHTFTEFAEQKLEEHIAELKTQYEGKTMSSEDEKKTAYDKHFKMFSAELKEKIKELGEEEENHPELKKYQERFKASLP